NDLLAPFELRFKNDVATVAAEAVRGTLRLPIFETADVSLHAATVGVRKVSYGSGCSLDILSDRARALGGHGEGAVLLAAAEVGRGRVVAVGDSDLFALPFLSYNDNFALFIGLLSWLSGRSAAALDSEPGVERETEATAHDLVAHGLSADPVPAPG